MALAFFIAVQGTWLKNHRKLDRRMSEQHLIPIGTRMGGLDVGSKLLLKFRDRDGQLVVDDAAETVKLKDEVFLRSDALSTQLDRGEIQAKALLFFFEGSAKEARAVLTLESTNFFTEIENEDPTLRLHSFELPPVSCTIVDADHLVEVLQKRLSKNDPELFGVHASNFLNAPHILIPLFDHVLGLSSTEQIDFPVRLRKLAEQIRALLQDEKAKSVRIEKIDRNHNAMWTDVLGDRISFLDGGVARIAGMPGSEPLAMRVGIYTVRPGVESPNEREEWALKPYVIGDMTVDTPGLKSHTEAPDRKRLQEAARYILEPLTALAYLKERPGVRALFLHGPLVNQFLQYDEGEPNFIPCISSVFLERFGITKQLVEKSIQQIPSAGGELLWNQFMAIYGYVQRQLFNADRPVVGVVERSRGQWLIQEILERLVQDGVVRESYTKKAREVIDQFELSDDFLFGCVMSEGEYTTPIQIRKNRPARARERWQGVVEQYPKPLASVLKVSDTSFPYRVELNKVAGEVESSLVFRLLYHTSRLLPSYAFPVGLDIVDKYAKVPDWISRGVSARLAADVLRRALKTGDPRIVRQIRQFLAHTPRDFFYRPQID